jgi:hypothetical protein
MEGGASHLHVVVLGTISDISYRTADGYRVESSRTDDGVLASDHRPVFADVTL